MIHSYTQWRMIECIPATTFNVPCVTTSNRDRSCRVPPNGNDIFTSTNNRPRLCTCSTEARSHAHVRIILIAAETPMYHSRKFYCAYHGDRSFLVRVYFRETLLLSLLRPRTKISIHSNVRQHYVTTNAYWRRDELVSRHEMLRLFRVGIGTLDII